ncbi:MAG: MFS transporter [Thermoplasmata archaeon]|nr:MFS transporter [Thermoplasmata archaeon]
MEKKQNMRWVYSSLFANIAQGPLSTIVVLYILEKGGSVIEASFAITGGTLISIIASYVWGKFSDIYQRRKIQIMISYIGLSLSLFILYLAKTPLEIILIYIFYSFMITANATPLNLIIMETIQESYWKRAFSNLQLASSLGGTIGLGISFLTTFAIPVKLLIILLFFISLISINLSYIMIPESKERRERKLFVLNLNAFISRLFITPFLWVRLTNESIIHMIKNFNFKEFRKTKIFKLYMAIFLFYIGSGLFNTVYPAGLKVAGLNESLVFLVIFIGMVVQTSMYFYIGINKRMIATNYNLYRSLILRGSSYLVIGLTFLFTATLVLYSNLIIYPLAAGIAFAIFYTVSNVLVFESIGEKGRGRALGFYTSMIQIGTLVGALTSGYISFYIGYWSDFMLAGVFVLLSLIFFRALETKKSGKNA